MADSQITNQNVDYFAQSANYGTRLVGAAAMMNAAMNFTQNFAATTNSFWMPQYARTNDQIAAIGMASTAATQTAASRIKKGK